ncbi:MAG: gliding motility-associated C-terminal domain-containing protein [Candidatus Azobacteroides sp.]|nr:gliding motility-associated C-terminal domain-containing protein [Candidatus Azobacteroides sp.]
MKKAILHIICLFGTFPVFPQYLVKGGNGQPLLAEDNNAIQVYLLNGLNDAQISYTSSTAGMHQWYRYNTRVGEAVPVVSQQNGNTSTLSGLNDGYGYYVESSTGFAAPVWVIDYSQYLPSFLSFFVQEEDDKCQYLKLIANVDADPLVYYTIAGERRELQRTYHLQYDGLKWDEETKTFLPVEIDQSQKGVISEIVIDAPLKNTAFTLRGDDYAKYFGLEQINKTAVYEAIALDIHSEATIHRDTGENEQSDGNTDLGGSAPVVIDFTASANEPVAAMYIWEIFKLSEDGRDSTTIVRYVDKSVNYPFNQSGKYAARLEVINANSTCFDNSSVFNISIEQSVLKLPNAFSPGSSPGINDEYRVSYRSLISFKASIYNRWGNLLYTWNDPSKGWDGKVNGKFVPTGVYFIVVEAKGADGIRYKESKDINILRSKNN